jgi:hypothetical protein
MVNHKLTMYEFSYTYIREVSRILNVLRFLVDVQHLSILWICSIDMHFLYIYYKENFELPQNITLLQKKNLIQTHH